MRMYYTGNCSHYMVLQKSVCERLMTWCKACRPTGGLFFR